jgi:hypothetical protein
LGSIAQKQRTWRRVPLPIRLLTRLPRYRYCGTDVRGGRRDSKFPFTSGVQMPRGVDGEWMVWWNERNHLPFFACSCCFCQLDKRARLFPISPWFLHIAMWDRIATAPDVRWTSLSGARGWQYETRALGPLYYELSPRSHLYYKYTCSLHALPFLPLAFSSHERFLASSAKG